MFTSWESASQNQSITSDTINQVLGSSQVQLLAQMQAADFIASKMPKVIDQFTPDGKVEPNAAAESA